MLAGLKDRSKEARETGMCEVRMKGRVALPDGDYGALFYGYCVEINEHIFDSEEGVRCPRRACGGPKPVRVRDGRLFRIVQ